MKILSIKISNILSFKHSRMDDCPEIIFDDELNLLIGPNGAGKSNFLEILNQIFKKGIVSTCDIDPANLTRFDSDPSRTKLKNTITAQQTSHTLGKNHYATSNDQEIELKMKLSKNDYENMFFILDNVVNVNLFLEKYTNQPTRFNTAVTKNDLKIISEIIFYLKSKSDSKTFSHTTNMNNLGGQFIQDYFFLFDIIQYLILITNNREGTKWPSLKNTFALIGSYRNYNSIASRFDLNQPKLEKWKTINLKIRSDETRISKNEEPIIFEYIKNKLTSRLNYFENELSEGLLSNPNSQSALDFLKQEHEFKILNELLGNYLNISMEIIHERGTLNYDFHFKDSKKRNVVLEDLSAGQKGIIHFIFSIYGFDLESGVIIIDEPEIHLHPQIQEKYLDIIHDTVADLQLQFIIATHSPIFINEKTIEHVYRFYKNKDDFTEIKTASNITPDMKNRIQMLTYTNSAIVFFAEHIILTEGYRDYIFFKKYLNSYAVRHQKDISKISLLQMDGAGEYQKWTELLQEFNINTSYIGDTDNLKNSYISTKSNMWNAIAPDKMLQNHILALKQSNGPTHDIMIKEIKSLTEKNIFLLTEGSFEDYFTALTSITKATKNITNFCISDQFDIWFDGNYFKKYVQEFESMLFQIVN